MKLSSAIICLTIQLFALHSFCQSSIDEELSTTYRRLQQASIETRSDSLAPLFKKQMMKSLSSSFTFENNLDNLASLIVIRQSPDKKVKFYSWDELEGGSWHSIIVFAQFKSSANKTLFRQLNTGGFTDSKIYEVNEIRKGATVYYVTFGWGTHGSGYQHQIIQVFKFIDDKLVKCRGEWDIMYPRTADLNLQFNKSANTVSFNDTTGKRTTLTFANGAFK